MPVTPSLLFMAGPRAGEAVPVPASGLLIGRKPSNDLVLDDPSVSGRHALIRAEGEGLVVEDLGSTNGTRIDGERIQRAVLKPGQRVKLGNVEFELASDAAPAQVPGPAPASKPASPPAQTTVHFEEGGLELEEEIFLSEDPAPIPALPIGLPAAGRLPAKPAPEGQPARPQRRATAAKPAAAAKLTPSAGDADLAGFETLDASRVRGGRSSWWIAAVLILAIGGVAAWMQFGSGPEEGSKGPALAELPGNWLGADWSFELPEAQSAYQEDQEAPLRFSRSRGAALSGSKGIGIEVDSGLWAALDTPTHAATPERWVEARLSVQSGASLPGIQPVVGLALVFESSRGERPAFEGQVFLAPSEVGATLSVSLPAPAGLDRVKARVIAAASGDRVERAGESEPPVELAIDDLVLRASDAGRSLAMGDFQAVPFGSPADLDGAGSSAPLGLLLMRQNRPLAQISWAEADLLRAANQGMELDLAESDPIGFSLSSRGSGRWLEVWLEPALLERSERALATVAVGEAGGYQSHGDRFERTSVQQLLIGRDLDLVRLAFKQPVRVEARPDGERVRVRIDLGAVPQSVEVQLVFSAERAQAAVEAAAARRAQSNRALGEVWARYANVLERTPFERELVAEAEAACGRIESEGLAELEQIEQQLERASFFGLAGQYDECEQAARGVATRHAPFAGRASPVLLAAQALEARIAARRAELSRPQADLTDLSGAALRSALESSGQAKLAEILERLADGSKDPR